MLLDEFDSYMWYTLLAKWFLTNVTTIYWTLTLISFVVVIIMCVVYYFILRSKK